MEIVDNEAECGMPRAAYAVRILCSLPELLP